MIENRLIGFPNWIWGIGRRRKGKARGVSVWVDYCEVLSVLWLLEFFISFSGTSKIAFVR